jgi:hypothetical protein
MSLLSARGAAPAATAPAAPAKPGTTLVRSGLFRGMKEASFSQGGNYMEPDQSFDLEVDLLRTFNDKLTEKVDIFVADFKVIGTTSSRPTNAPGQIVNYYTDDKGGHPMFLGNIKALMVAIYGSLMGRVVSPDEIGEEEAEALFGMPTDKDGNVVPGSLPGTMARGVHIRCQTRTILTKKERKPFTVHSWFPIIPEK